MELPLVVLDLRDALIFDSIRSLEAYVEAPDAPVYEVFDSSGRRFHFRGYGPNDPLDRQRFLMSKGYVKLDLENPGGLEPAYLKKRLLSILAMMGDDACSEASSLETLIERVGEKLGRR